MSKHQKAEKRRFRVTAVLLAAVMAAQTVAPAMASIKHEDVQLTDAKESGSTASRSDTGRGWGKEGATPSDATPSDSTREEKATLSNAPRKAAENVLPNSSFEETTTTAADWKWAWVNEVIPTGWRTWAATPGSKKISHEIIRNAEEAHEGENYLRIRSEDKTSRISINYPVKTGVDNTVEYLCTFWLKMENVEGAGLCVRLAQAKAGGTGSSYQIDGIKGTTDGWVQYGFTTNGFPAAYVTGIQIDIFSEFISGDIWLDDIQIVPAYRINIDKTKADMFTGETLKLDAVCSDGYAEEIQWYSQNPDIADVDENGVVTAYKMGMVDIVAKTDDFHEVSCKISVEDGELREYYPAIRENWKNRLTGNNMEDTSDEVYQAMMSALTDKAAGYWETMIKGGNERTELWSDITFIYKYQNTTANITEGLGTGFSRIEQMAAAYSSKGSGLYRNPELKEDIIGALEWVYKTMYNDTLDPQKDTYGNWWHWFIGMPQSLCNTVILMYDDMDQDLIDREAKTLENFNWDPNERYVVCGGKLNYNKAGNLIDTSLVSALRSSIGETARPLNMAKEALDGTIGFVTEGNGYYEDGSYIDHGNLAYTGGYGSTLLGGMEKLLFITGDSPWEVDSDELISIFQWIWNGIRPLYADGAMMDMTTGRGIARPSSNGHTVGRGLLKPISHLVEIAPDNMREELRRFARTEINAGLEYDEQYFIGMTVADMAVMRRLVTDESLGEEQEVYHKNFGVMDKAVYHGENFDLGISMYSRRTGNFEFGNKENKKGWHMSDGALYLHNGDQSQYADVYWPTVDPHRLAGITTDHTEGFIPSDNSWNPHVSSKNWVGGSSVLDRYGAVGMDFEGEKANGSISSLKAKKSWFTFPDLVVALGTGINSNEGKATETMIDNRKVMEDAVNTVWVDGIAADLTVGTARVMTMNWALLEGNEGEQQNIGYYFPEQTEISVLKETRTGNWKDINGAITSGSANDKAITRSYISFAADHGINPQNETYSYVLLPGRSPEEMAEFSENPQIKILANTSEVQAVENTEYNVSGYNFWSASSDGQLEVSAETPASVTLAKEGGIITAGISNPTQNRRDTTIVLKGYYAALEMEEGMKVTNRDGDTIIHITGAEDFGKTYTVVLESLDTKLADWQVRIQNAGWAEKADMEAILAELQAFSPGDFNEAQKELTAALIKAIQEKMTLVDVVEEVMTPVTDVSEVTFDNADEVEEMLNKYYSLTQDQASLLSEEDRAIIKKLEAGFLKEEVHTQMDGVMVHVLNGTMDVRTSFHMADESDFIGIYQAKLPDAEPLLSLFNPGLFLKNENLSLELHPVRVSMESPVKTADDRKNLKLYRFAPAVRSRSVTAFAETPLAQVPYTEVPFTAYHDGTISFEVKQNGIYGFAVEKKTKPEQTDAEDHSGEDASDGRWILDANGWWYCHYNGTWPSSQWKWVKGLWYHFNETGYMQTGWIQDKGLWYYLKADGSMAVNEWILYENHRYYISGSGAMAE